MDNAKKTTARLRRTFQYNADDDADSQPDAMDEQGQHASHKPNTLLTSTEQESLIEELSATNAARNAQFTTFLLALPLLTTLPYLSTLLRLPSMLSLTSLLSTAFILRRLPPGVTGIAPLDAWSRTRDDVVRSPLETYLPYLNGALAIMLAIMGFFTERTAEGFGGVGKGNLPGLVFVVVLVAKMVMASVDPERELSSLKYDYKGA